MVGLASYDSGAKQTWRGWQWNRIAERIPKCQRRDAVVVYLVGPDDLDRKAAIGKGFRNRNLIAVDIDHDNVRRVREAGGVAIACNLQDAIAHWPADIKLSAIVADFTCGLSASSYSLWQAALHCFGMRRGTVFSVNLQRGRDPWSNRRRDGFSERLMQPGQAQAYFRQILEAQFFGDIRLADPIKHRGWQWQQEALLDLIVLNKPPDATMAECDRNAVLFSKMMDPKFGSYKSWGKLDNSALVFDSIVFSFPLELKPQVDLRFNEEDMGDYVEMRHKIREAGKQVRVNRQSIIAKLARLKTLRDQAPEFPPEN